MYPYYVIDLGEQMRLGLYEIFLLIGVIACLALFRVFADRAKYKARIQNFTLISGLAAIALGYYAAALTQTFYNWKAALATTPDAKLWDFWGTGATFYGGLVGGVLVFLAVYFGIGSLVFKKQEHIRHFFPTAHIAGAIIPLAHGFGRLGCLGAGCCHGQVFAEKQWYTFTFYTLYTDGSVKPFYAVPVQLFEALFLFALAAVLIWRVIKNKHYNLSVYMMAYGVWRFFAEYLRADARGEGLIPFLSPSQQTAILLIAVGVGVIFLERFVRRHYRTENEQAEAASVQSAEVTDETSAT